MSDAAFADFLFSDPDKALSGFDLTPEEVAKLRNMSHAAFDKLAHLHPEERKS
jgi:hypothetical protein